MIARVSDIRNVNAQPRIFNQDVTFARRNRAIQQSTALRLCRLWKSGTLLLSVA